MENEKNGCVDKYQSTQPFFYGSRSARRIDILLSVKNLLPCFCLVKSCARKDFSKADMLLTPARAESGRFFLLCLLKSFARKDFSKADMLVTPAWAESGRFFLLCRLKSCVRKDFSKADMLLTPAWANHERVFSVSDGKELHKGEVRWAAPGTSRCRDEKNPDFRINVLQEHFPQRPGGRPCPLLSFALP